MMEIQVKEGYYLEDKYTNLERFISYYYQVDSIRRCRPVTVLIIGDGTVSHFLKQRFDVTTVDIDDTLNPNVIADIRKLPFEPDSFDVVCAFEVLEHLPFEDFSKCLQELSRVSKKHVAISVPQRTTDFEMTIKFPFVRSLFNKSVLRILRIQIPLIFGGFESSGQHYWEIDRSQFSLRKVRGVIKDVFNIEEERVPLLDTYHRFFTLSKHQES